MTNINTHCPNCHCCWSTNFEHLSCPCGMRITGFDIGGQAIVVQLYRQIPPYRFYWNYKQGLLYQTSVYVNDTLLTSELEAFLKDILDFKVSQEQIQLYLTFS